MKKRHVLEPRFVAGSPRSQRSVGVCVREILCCCSVWGLVGWGW
jgi:hypothetical protein